VGLPAARFTSFPGLLLLTAKPSLAMGEREQQLVNDGLQETSHSDKGDVRKHQPCALV